jgi:hydroxymethylbilane synthase
VADWLEAAHPGLTVDLVPMITEGDRLPGNLAEIGGKGAFTWELEARLLEGSLDLAVHSLKDLPIRFQEELVLAAFPPRADPRDVLVSETASRLEDLPGGAVLLTSSLRRRAQILAARPDLEVRPVRGNVETRVRKWRQGGVDGLLLAAAGLERLGLGNLPAHPLDPAQMLPAPGQGILALQARRGSDAEALCRSLDDPTSAEAARAERAVVATFGGDCTLPLAAWARREGASGPLRLAAFLGAPDGSLSLRAEAQGEGPEDLALRCARDLRSQGADDLLNALGRAAAG